jgi:hypothetical protein
LSLFLQDAYNSVLREERRKPTETILEKVRPAPPRPAARAITAAARVALLAPQRRAHSLPRALSVHFHGPRIVVSVLERISLLSLVKRS